MVLVGVVVAVVDAHHDRDVLVGGGRRDDHLLGAGLEVLARVAGLGEQTGRLDHDVGADLAPAQGGGVTLGGGVDLAPVDGQVVVVRLDDAREASEDRVVAQEVREDVVGRRGR